MSAIEVTHLVSEQHRMESENFSIEWVSGTGETKAHIGRGYDQMSIAQVKELRDLLDTFLSYYGAK